MHWMMPVELSFHKSMMVQNFESPFYPIHFWKIKENGAELNRKLMEFLMPLQNGITLLASLYWVGS